ncbi:HD domain-containing protein [Clostridium sp. ATCC 25772]|uniref:HD domain-containing protein n=1 Tax=Clostridium sp. ATCC 25772 TaxID=1676991 RepID=UPI000783FA80|nr:HD domain-containing protein [Clostridium sp. ATCC 25772]
MNDKINSILKNTYFKEALRKLNNLEGNRMFCIHGIEHSMDVARIGYIISLEQKLNIPKELIYGAALLHDLGRVMEYEKNIPHDKGSVILATKILEECLYSKEECEEIIKAISSHREKESEKSILGDILYKSDKLSRMCFSCKAKSQCYWNDEKKNLKIKY